MIRKKVMTAIALLFTASIILTFGGVTSANAQTPILPDSFYGSLTVNADPAPAGVTLVAKIDGVVRGDFTTEQVGRYGYSGAGEPKLLVEGTSDDIGTEIQFYIENYDGTLVLASNNPTPIFESGADPQEVDLIFEGVQLQAPSPAAAAGIVLAPDIETNLFGVEGEFSISEDGEIQVTITATSEAGDLTLTIEEGTIALDVDGNPLSTLTSDVDVSPPDPPEDANIIGLAYDFGPAGATFDPPITFTWSYDPDALPEGMAEEDLVLAYHDEATGEWVELDGVVDTVNNTITASVAHFTTFAIIGSVTEEEEVVVPPRLAAFSVSNLSIEPADIEPEESVTISVSVANTGGKSGSYTVVLKINGVKEAEETVTVAAGDSEDVSFSVTKEETGSYTVAVNGLSGSFTVVPVVVPPEPAAFSVSSLSITPLEIEPGETVTVAASVANTGGESGSYTVVLKIDGVKEAEETVTVAAGDSQNVSFSVTREEAGSYTVAVDGLSGSFTVLTPPVPPGINWPLVGGIIGGVIVVGLGVFFFVRRRAY